jgi:hypothetical protein
MSHAVDQLDRHPEPREYRCRCPPSSQWPKKAPDSKSDERDIEENEAKPSILGNQPAHKSCGREHFIQSPHILFNGVGRLNSDESNEAGFEARHENASCLTFNSLAWPQSFKYTAARTGLAHF